jgi:hypothetical protein
MAPLEQMSLFNASVLMYARVKGQETDQIVFVVAADGGGETIVLGVKSDDGGYWKGYFEGPDGDYSVSARAHVSQGEFFSEPRSFTLTR